MDPAAALGLLRRRWLPLLLSLLVGIGGALLMTSRTPKTYEASTRLIVNIPQARDTEAALQGVQLSTQLLRSYAKVAVSRTAAERVKERFNLPESVPQLQRKLSAAPESGTLLLTITAQDHDRTRAASIADTTAVVFIEAVAELEADSKAPVQASVIDKAVAGSTPVSPKPAFNLLVGVGLGLLVGFAAALVLDALDRSVKTPGQTSELFAAPLLAMIPRAKGRELSPTVTVDDQSAPESEAYRALRTAVRFIDPDRPLSTILVTSPSAGDGKTTTASNLALALAQSGERVLLVDADLRRSRLAATFNIEPAVGLTNMITHRTTPAESLQPWGELLSIVASGPLPPNPSELLGSQSMSLVIQELRDLCDVVIFDAPPVIAVTDAVVLATQVDGVILVARSGKTQRSLAAEARRRLEGVGANVVGCVLNAVPASASQGYYEDYRYVSASVPTAAPNPGRRWSDRVVRSRAETRR